MIVTETGSPDLFRRVEAMVASWAACADSHGKWRWIPASWPCFLISARGASSASAHVSGAVAGGSPTSSPSRPTMLNQTGDFRGAGGSGRGVRWPAASTNAAAT